MCNGKIECIDIFVGEEKKEKWTKYSKKCPECGEDQFYSNQEHLNRAIKGNLKCKSCSHKKRKLSFEEIERRKTLKYIKKCPICKNPQEYTSKGSLVAAIKNNTQCKDCYDKSKIKPIPKKGWTRTCPTCKKTIMTYKNKGSLTIAIKNNTDCDICSYKKRSLSPEEKEISKERRKETKKAYHIRIKNIVLSPEEEERKREKKKFYRERPGAQKKQKEYMKNYLKIPEIKKRRNRKRRERRKNNIMAKLSCYMSNYIRFSLKLENLSKNNIHWENLIINNLQEIKEHLEKNFLPDMSWKNYGKLWHIHHIIPIVFFKFTSTDDVEFKYLWSIENLTPLWGKDNRKKSDKITIWGKEINARFMERDYFSKIDSFHNN